MSNITNICVNGTTYGIGSTDQGVSEALKVALLQLADKVAYIDEDGQDYYDALNSALYPPANLVSISAVYTQSGTVYNTDTLDSLKSDLVVTAHYDNGTSAVVTTYTLSGTLTPGTSVVAVVYGGKTTTFNVTVTRYDTSIYSWDFTQSLVDAKQGATAVLSDATRSSDGVTFNSNSGFIYLADLSAYASTQYTVEIDFGTLTAVNASTYPVNISTSSSTPGNNGLRFYGNYWNYYLTNNNAYYPEEADRVTDAAVFANKTLKFQCDYTNRKWTTYADSTKIIETTSAYQNSNGRNYMIVGALPSGSVVKAVRIYEGIG